MDGGAQAVAGLQAVRLGKGFADQHFVMRKGRELAAAAQVQAVLQRLALVGQRLQHRLDRVGETGQLDLGGGHQPRLDAVHPGQFGHAGGHGQRRALDLHPQV